MTQRKIDLLLLIIFLLVGGWIRMDGVLSGDFPFLFDNGRDMLSVKQIFVDHKPTLIGVETGLQGVFQSPLWFYLLGIPFLISRGSPVATMIFMVILGLVGILLAYFVGRQVFGREAGLILALFFTLSPSVISLSRIFWPPYPIPYLMLLFLFFVLKAISVGGKYWYGAGLVAGMTSQLEVAYGIFLLPTFIFLFILFSKGKTSLKFLLGGVFFYLLNFLPQVFFDLRHNFLMTHSILRFFSGESRGLGAGVPFSDRLLHRLNELMRITINSLSYNHFLIFLFFSIIIFSTVFFFLRKKKKEIKMINAMILIPLVYFFGFLIYPYVAWTHYWIGLQAVYLILLAFVLGKIASFKMGKFFVLLLLIFWFVDTVRSPGLYVKKDEGGPTTYKNEIGAIDYVYQDAKGEKFSVFVYTPPVYDYTYQYLFWWRGLRKHGFFPGKDKDGLFYLIIEPDPERPWGPQAWEENIIKTGKTIEEKRLPGGIIVERRHGEGYVKSQ